MKTFVPFVEYSMYEIYGYIYGYKVTMYETKFTMFKLIEVAVLQK